MQSPAVPTPVSTFSNTAGIIAHLVQDPNPGTASSDHTTKYQFITGSDVPHDAEQARSGPCALKEGIDYNETFAATAKAVTWRVILSLGASLDWPAHQLDVVAAFLNGTMEEEVYLQVPPFLTRLLDQQPGLNNLGFNSGND